MAKDAPLAPAARGTAPTGDRLAEVAGVFLKLGIIGFGGPAAHIAMMEQEVVQRRRWVDRQTFLDLLGATNLIPGPNSTEMAIHLGYQRAGWPGLIVGGACFIIPAMVSVWGLAVAYVKLQAFPQVGWLLYGIKPVIVAIVAHALWGLFRLAVKNTQTALAGAGVAALAVAGWNEIGLLFLAGAAVMLVSNWRRLGGGAAVLGAGPLILPGLAPGAPPFLAAAPGATAAAAVPATPEGLFWFFLKIGSVLYGGGYVLLAFLQTGLVDRLGWLSSQQLLDAVAVGQFTPGPLFTTATFIGYLVAGTPGALLATLGIFLPAFVFVALSYPWIPRIRQSPWAAGFLDGVNVASLALMAVVTWHLGRAALINPLTGLLALASLGLMLRYRVNSAWLVLGGGAVGVVAKLAGF